MNRRLLMPALFGATLAIAGCRDSAPLSPALDAGDVGPVLAAAPGIPVTFYIDVGPGEPENPECLRKIGSGITLIHMCVIRATLPYNVVGEPYGEITNSTPGAVVWIVTGKQDSEGNGRGYGRFTLTGEWDAPFGLLNGVFEGGAEIKWTQGIGEGRLHARGTGGAFWGLQMWGVFVEQEDPPGTGNFVVTVTGTIR